jgi:hypothetical protein
MWELNANKGGNKTTEAINSRKLKERDELENRTVTALSERV